MSHMTLVSSSFFNKHDLQNWNTMKNVFQGRKLKKALNHQNCSFVFENYITIIESSSSSFDLLYLFSCRSIDTEI